MSRIIRWAAAAVCVASATASAGQGCSWEGLGEGLNTSVLDFGEFGDQLIAVGLFSSSGGTDVGGVARWDGSAWSPLGLGIGGTGYATASYVSPAGRELYVGGRFNVAGGVFSFNIGRWNGESWQPVGGGLDGTVRAMAVHDDGSGEALYVGGEFNFAGGLAVAKIARWDGTNWSAVGDGFGGPFARINTLAVFDDGSGPALYAGGQQFTVTGETGTNRVAKWDGESWSYPGVGIDNSIVYAMQAWDDGTGEALYVAGSFLAEAPGQPGRILTKWDGVSWSDPSPDPDNTVFDLSLADFGAGEQLIATGSMESVGGEPTSFVAAWDGTDWTTFDGGNDIIWTSTGFNDGSGDSLFIGGNVTTIGGETVSRVAKYQCGSVCLADVNGDGALNGLDFGAWLGAFNAGLPGADQNGDGMVNGLDFGAWLAGFNAGCP